MTRAAATQGRSQFDLYEENRGRIPPFAWQLPHRLEPWTDVPIPADVPTGPGPQAGYQVTEHVRVRIVEAQDNATFSNGWFAGSASITPIFDDYVRGGPRVTLVILIRMGSRFSMTPDGTGEMTTVPTPAAGGYGRATTAADRAGGEVDPYGVSVNFHEGQHAMNYMDFLRQNPPPVWEGPRIATFDQQLYERYLVLWKASWSLYLDRMVRYTIKHTHCVGVTSDEWGRRHPDAKHTPECGH
jgi:hypothetical protein